MKKKVLLIFSILILVVGITGFANAAVIDFTGGTVYNNDGTTGLTNNSNVYSDVDYYIEDGFKLDFLIPGSSNWDIVGDYYSTGNDIIHGHWDTGDFGTLETIMITKEDSSTFDLNYFMLTSNTDTGGSVASGLEQAWINSSNGFSQLLPSEDWGFPATQIWLDDNFDDISWFSFTVSNAVDCFGMDEFYLDEEAPPGAPVPEPSTILLMGAGLLGLVGYNRKRFSKMS